jgi:uncharacterized membrane protein
MLEASPMTRPLDTHAPRIGSDRWLAFLVLAASSALSVLLFALRHFYTGHPTFFFLNWNLFLAWIPLFCAAGVWLLQRNHARPRLRAAPLLALWLLFFPNAPYILTDLLHLAPRAGVPLWYDLLLLLSYAWNGLILGFASLWIVHGLLQRWYGAAVGWLGAGAVLVAGAVGIYLGRFERWNSWDLLTDPAPILRSLAATLLDPTGNLKAVAVVALMAGLLGAMYLTLTLLTGAGKVERRIPIR